MPRISFVLSLLLLPLAESVVRSAKLARSAKGGKRLKVAFAAFITELSGETWEDAAAVLAHGIHQAGRRSRHDVEAIVLSPDTLPKHTEKYLLEVGFDKVVKRPVPVLAEDIQDSNTRHEMKHIQGTGQKGVSFSLEAECIKYQALGLTDYDRVLVLDLDTMVLDPMDAIMEAKEDLVGTYDVAMNVGMRNAVPTVQGGFLLVRPNASDLEAIKRITREGRFDGMGWEGSRIGYAYGGVGPSGMMSYYFHKELLPKMEKLSSESQEMRNLFKEVDPARTEVQSLEDKRFLALDRTAYDVLDTAETQKSLKGEDIKATMARLKSAHFTGGCAKPWMCADPDRTPLCRALTDAWWSQRKSLANARDVEETERCKAGGAYRALPRTKKQ